VLLLDEPTANLDLGHQLDVIAAAKSRADRGAALVAILHDLNLAALLATRLVVLNRGRIDSDGPADQVITDPMLGRAFGVADAVACIPAQGTPFVLPHGAHKLLPATP
jgi:iron complex transport system ATP-binding protein